MKQNRLLMLTLAAAVLPAAHAADAPSDAALRRCRNLPEATRLACYDALPLAPLAAAPASPTPVAASVVPAAPAGAVIAPSPALRPPSNTMARIAPLPEDAATPVPPAEANFGLENQRASLQAISTRIPGVFEGWDSRSKIRLANGQVWQVIDGSTAALYLRDPKVKIERAALGSFRLEIEGTRQAPRVQRVE